MARGKKGIGPPVVADEPTAAQAAEVEQQSTRELPEPRVREGAPAKRLALPIDDKGKIMWDSMRVSTKEEVRKIVEGMLRDPELAASFGINKPLVDVFPVEWTGALYDSLGAIEIALAPKMLGVSPEIARTVFAYSSAEKEKLAGPTSRVINKYAADWLIRFKDEIALLMLLGSITYAKIMMAKMAQEAMNKMANAPKPNGKTEAEPANA